ncbi:HBL/NHE enterotoxin family protein [Yokenella regensburgei]|uniref:HBL/NHE enterotoxin family protein n=1 Tax=Yokenella regensburgei TaxID=158877 RepID=UPI0013759FF2|nr:HBL/NHE enterotoxin family protein [Yokenella regensburgei]KAF1366503.1 non-hemolytic enterotoxin B/C [Yokenella regensburgei]
MTGLRSNLSCLQKNNKPLTSFILAVIGYDKSLKNQGFVDFSGLQNLSSYEKDINKILSSAQSGHGYNIENLISMLTSFFKNMETYCELFKFVVDYGINEENTSVFIKNIRALANNCYLFKIQITNIQEFLLGYYSAFSEDERNFLSIVGKLNAAIGGDNGVLENISHELKNIQKKIDSAGSDAVVSAFGISVGALMICVGAIGEFLTGGVSTAVVLGGIGLITAGIAGEGVSAAQLIELNNEKASLLNQEANLEAEVKIAAAISHGYSSLIAQVDNAKGLGLNMCYAAENIESDLLEIANDLESGSTSIDIVRTLFIDAAANEMSTLLSDVKIMKEQISSLAIHCAMSNQTVSELIAALAKNFELN